MISAKESSVCWRLSAGDSYQHDSCWAWFVSGHGFSRAAADLQRKRALAPAVPGRAQTPDALMSGDTAPPRLQGAEQRDCSKCTRWFAETRCHRRYAPPRILFARAERQIQTRGRPGTQTP